MSSAADGTKGREMAWVTDANAALLTDLYELTMAASYFAHSMNDSATFDLFVRELPPNRNFFIACGLQQALDYLESLRLDDESISYLSSLNLFRQDFLDFLSDLTFTGEVWAVPEGEPAFPAEPLLQVTAPLIEAQIVETFLLNCVCFQTMVASKAARVSLACGSKPFVDFSPRRDHGADAALKGARAAFVGGASATSNVLAGQLFGIPVNGTMAHSYVMAFEDESEAFRAFVKDYPKGAVLLIDTFNVEEGARRAARVIRELPDGTARVRGVRLDSGDLAPMTKSVRRILDDAGLNDVQIVLSGDLDEFRIEELLDADVPVDAFGVGTQLGTSGDAPSLGGVYKLVADAGTPKMKTSTGKATLPGQKQVYRVEKSGRYDHDVISRYEEEISEGRPVLRPVMEKGRRIEPDEPLEDVRSRCRQSLQMLPERLKKLEKVDETYEVRRSPKLQELVEQMQRETG